MGTALGLIGAVAFMFSAFPQAWKCWSMGHARDVAAGTLALWVIGEVAMVGYTALELHWDPYLLSNYAMNLLGLAVIVRFKWLPRSA